MPRIYVEYARMKEMGNSCKAVSSLVSNIRSGFRHTVSQLDWDVKYQSNINATAEQLSRKLEGYSQALKTYQSFLDGAYDQYVKLDEVKFELPSNDGLVQNISAESRGFQFDYSWKDFIKSFGNVGGIYGIIDKILKASTWNEWANVGLGIATKVSKIAKDVTNYAKIGNAIGAKNATAYFWRKQFGFNTVGHASTASSPTARFYNNLHNTTSPYNLSDAFKPLTGKSGVFKTVAAWAGVALTGVSNAFSNIEEQKESNGTMSTGRVVAETISETAIDTVVTYAGTAVVGAAITAATGVVAVPVAVAVATGVAIAGINAGVKAITGKTATEWASDAILDTATAVGSAVADGARAVANWFGRLSFA